MHKRHTIILALVAGVAAGAVRRENKAFMDIINGLSSPKYSVFKYKNKIYRPQ